MSVKLASQPTEMTAVSDTAANDSSSSLSEKDQEIAHLRLQLARSNERLNYMSEGMRLLATQIRQADLTAHPIMKTIVHCDDQTTIATDDCDTVLSDEDNHHDSSSSSVVVMAANRARAVSAQSVDPTEMRLCEITDELSQSQTADLLALHNAAHMLQEHARLSSEEAVYAVHDAVQAQRELDEWKRRAIRAEANCAHLHPENHNLKARNEKLAAERKVLIKEVRRLRKALSERQDYWGQFGSYIMGAMNMHEQQLKKKPSDVTDDFSAYSVTSDEGATVTLKTDKPIHAESEIPVPNPSPQHTPRMKNSAPTFPAGPDFTAPLVRSKEGPVQKLSSLGGGLATGLGNANRAMRREVQRRLAKSAVATEDTYRRATVAGSPPERIDVYPGECVSPVMSYDSTDGVWSVDSNHSKTSVVDDLGLNDKECSGCTPPLHHAN